MVRIAAVGFEAAALGGLDAAAGRHGGALVPLEVADIREDAPVDVIVASGVGLRKLTSHPTFLWVDRPAIAYAAQAPAFAAACAFDGWLCADPAAGRLFQALAAGLDRPLRGAVVGGDPIEAGLQALARFRQAQGRLAASYRDSPIDVIMRTGGRARETVRMAVASLEAQSAGRIRLILVRHGPADLAWISPRGSLAEAVVIDAPGANRGRALAAGLAEVRSAHFALLDDDDYLLADHYLGLLTAAERAPAGSWVAYCDILRLDETARSPRAALSILKEGPAAGPLGAVLERFCSHSFLASATALDRVAFDHWDMATGEDSLLIAALLRHAAPVHASDATAVYSQGAGGASDFQGHPQRRADEVALYAETFAWRAEIEARFPSVSPDPLEHLRPALRRLEAEAEGRGEARVVATTGSAPSEAVVSGADLHGGAFGGDESVFVRVPLTPERATGAALYFEPQGGGVQVGRQDPWEVVLRVDVTDYALHGCPTWAVAAVKGDGPPIGLGVVDAEGGLIERTDVEDTAAATAVEARGSSGRAAPAVILQAGERGGRFLRIEELRVGFARAAAARALDLPADTPFEFLAQKLIHRFGRQVEGAPDPLPSRLTPLQFGEAAIFRHVAGAPAQGVLAQGGTGEKPWDYFAQAPIPPADPAAASWLRIELGPTPEGFSAFLVDQGFTGRVSDSVHVKAAKSSVELWFPAPAAPAWLVLQAGAEPRGATVQLVAVDWAA